MGTARSPESALDHLAVEPGSWSRRTTLRDGTATLLRPIRPADRDRLAEGFQRLSPTSRFLRFHADVDHLTEPQLDYLTRVDHVDHEAIVAIDLDLADEPGIGVARYIRDPIERQVAEAAVTVADRYHGLGAGTMLLGALSGRARQHGIEVFRHHVLVRNVAMLEVFDDLGATRHLEDGGLWRVDLALPDRERDLPDSPAGRAFMAVAREGPKLSELFLPVWRLLPQRLAARRANDEVEDAWLLPPPDELDAWLADPHHRGTTWPT
jgi:GNAT superfamily N-acetyltransferase